MSPRELVWCLSKGSVGFTYGAAYEFWIMWLFLGMMGGMGQVVMLCRRPGKRRVSLYVEAMIISHVPIISERVALASK